MAKKALGVATRFSSAIEDYVKAIYLLQQEQEVVHTSLLAEQLGVAPASATAMIQRLAKLNLLTHTPYRGVILTEPGRRLALEVLRHHRLLELFLVEALGYSWDEVHAEADVLEHAISETLEARIAELLGDPLADPHGDPIPTADLTVPSALGQPLASLPLHTVAEITRVTNQNPEHLRYLAELGLVPGACVQVRARAPFDGPLTLAVGATQAVIDSRLARTILVQEKPTENKRG